MTGERVTAAERAAMDLRDLAARVDAVADLRGLEGVDRPLPDGSPGASLLPAERDRVRALADLLRLVASGLGSGGGGGPEEAYTAGGVLRQLVTLPADAPVLAYRDDGCLDRATARVALAWELSGPDAGWQDRERERPGPGARLALLVEG